MELLKSYQYPSLVFGAAIQKKKAQRKHLSEKLSR